jgi:hypothetical protein
MQYPLILQKEYLTWKGSNIGLSGQTSLLINGYAISPKQSCDL